jgi:hypothetical protein
MQIRGAFGLGGGVLRKELRGVPHFLIFTVHHQIGWPEGMSAALAGFGCYFYTVIG